MFSAKLTQSLTFLHFLEQKRHRADGELNSRKVKVLRDRDWQEIEWRHLKVGDIVKVTNNESFPADLVILASRFVVLIVHWCQPDLVSFR